MNISRPDKTVSCYKIILLCIFFVVLGLSSGIIGPTLYLFEQNSISRDDELPLIFIGRGLGFITGWSLKVKNNHHKGINLRAGLIILTLSNFIIPWSSQIWWLMTFFFFQGISIMIVSKSIIHILFTKQYSRVSNRKKEFIYSFMMVGFSIAPLIVILLTPNQDVFQPRYLNHTKPTANLTQENGQIVESVLIRNRRSLVINPEKNLLNSSSIILTNTTQVPLMKFSNNSFENNTTTSSTKLSTNMKSSEIFKNNTTPFAVRNMTTTSPPSTISLNGNATTQVVHKPSVIDAKHLRQDINMADGSNAASGMKKFDEKLRIVVASNQKNDVSIKKENSPPSKAETTNQATEKAVNFNKTSVANANTTMVINKPLPLQENNGTLINDTNSTTTPRSELNRTTLGNEISMAVNTSSELVTEPKATYSNLTSNSPISSHVPSETLMTERPSTAKNTQNLSTPAMPTTRLPEKITEQLRVEIPTERPDYLSGEAPDPPFKILHKIINKSFNHLHKIYISLGFISFIMTIIASPISQILAQKCQGSLEDARQENREFQPLLSDEEADICSTMSQEHNSEGYQSSPSATNEELSDGVIDKELILEEVDLANNSSSHERNLPFIDIPSWPRINFPNDVNLLMLSFLQAGLEITYGGFLQSFTYVYLQWKYINSLLITTFFWLSNYLGHLLCILILSNVNYKFLEQNISGTEEIFKKTNPPNDKMKGCLNHSRIVKFLLCFLQLIGSLLCVVGTSLLVHFTSNPFLRLFKDYKDTGDLSSFKDAYWMGSIMIGFGLGMLRAVIMPTIIYFSIVTSRDSNGKQISLDICGNISVGQSKIISALFGQMILPAITGYIHRKFESDSASSALGGTALFISCVVLAFSMIDILQTIFNLDFVKLFFQMILGKEKKPPGSSMTTSEIVRRSKNGKKFKFSSDDGTSKLLD